MDRMESPWAVFYAAWERWAAPALPLPVDADDRRTRIAAAIREATRETTVHLRHDLEWSLVHSRLLAERFSQAAEAWLRGEAPDPIRLRSRLVGVWRDADGIRAVEEERRRATGEFLVGAAVGAGGPLAWPARDLDVAAELYAW